MTPEQFATYWRGQSRALQANRPAETLKIVLDGMALVKLRVQSRGEDSNDNSFAPYVPKYAEKRKEKGLQNKYVDFTDTGRLWANIRPEVTENTESSTTVVATARDAQNQAKLKGARRKRGNIVLPTKKEVQLLRDANLKRIQKYMKP